MIGVDCNILVQLAIGDHPANPKTFAAVQSATGQGQKLVLPWVVATEFLHIVTDPRRFSPPLSMAVALDWLKEFLALPTVALIVGTDESLNKTISWMRLHQLGRKRILDTHLAAILHEHGITRLMTSNPGDFSVFASFELVVP
jgi:predicted nucleic acid-binding protein